MTRLLITRPAPFAAETAAELGARGYDCVVAPALLARHAIPFSIEIAGTPTLLVTSPQAAIALAAWYQLHDLPTLAVGARTAEILQTGCFLNIRSADSDVDGLLRLIDAEYAAPRNFLLASAPDTGQPLCGALEQRGHRITRLDVYEMRPAHDLPEAAVAALQDGRLTHALFTSARGAAAFLALAESANLMANLPDITALCLSEAVAAAVRAASWRSVQVAARPTADALHNLLPAID